MLIFGEIWKKMETFGKIWEVINKKRPEGRYAVHRGMLIQGLGVRGQVLGRRWKVEGDRFQVTGVRGVY